MKRTTIILSILLGIISTSFAQWPVTYSSRGNFSFSMPSYPYSYDTVRVLAYAYAPGDASNISYHVEFIDSAYVSGNEELQSLVSTYASVPSDSCYVDSIETTLNAYAQLFQYNTKGTIEGFETSNYIPCVIRGRELTVRHPNLSGDAGYCFTFTRYYYYNSKFLIFTITGPESNLAALYAYKNQFFNSIYIY
jgi:hypothetical protein